MKSRARNQRRGDTIQFPDQRNFADGERKLHLGLRELRAAVEEGGASSVGRAVARLHVEFIADLLRFKDRFEYFMGGSLFIRDLEYALKDNFRQEMRMLDVHGRLCDMLMKAGSGLISSVGGIKTLEIEALASWAAVGDPNARSDAQRLKMLEAATACIQAQNEAIKLRRSKR